MEAFSFGSYYPGDSAIHRLDPRTKLLLGFVFLITTLTVSSFRGLAPVAIFVVLIYAVSRVPLRRVLSSMAPLLAIVVVVAVLNLFSDQSGRILWQLGFLQISEGSLRSAAFMACRLTLMMAGMSAITLTTPTLDLTAGFERLLAPFARVGLPAHELGMIMGIALRFMPQFATEMKQTAAAKASSAPSQSNPAELTRIRAVTAELSAVNALSTSMPAPTGSMEENASLNSTLSNLRIMPETPP